MLLRDINKVKEFIKVNATKDYERLEPFVKDAERIIQEVIGAGFYSELDVYFTDPTPADAYFDKLILMLQESIVYLAFDLGFDIMNTVISNQGFHRIENEDGSKKALFQRQEENLRRTFKNRGYNKLDLALEFLEDNQAQFATWAGSGACTLFRRNFINSAREFSKIYNINNSCLVFLKLRVAQELVEDFDILPLIGHEFYDELKTQVASNNLSDANLAFMAYLKKAVAYRSIYRAGASLLIELNELGMYQTEFDINSKNSKKESAIKFDIANSILEKAGATGKSYLKTCESFLKKNIDSYPLYANSDAYDEEKSVFSGLTGTDKVVVI